MLKIGFKQVTQHLISQCFNLKMIIIGGIIPLDCLEDWIIDTQKETCTICHVLFIASCQFIEDFVTMEFNSTHLITFHDVRQNSKGHDPWCYAITFPYFVQETQNLNTKKCSSKSENSPQPTFFQKMIINDSEVQWHGRRIKVGHIEGKFFCWISFSKIQIFPILYHVLYQQVNMFTLLQRVGRDGE